MSDFVIVGGGVAGLSAAIRLAELGVSPLVLESGTYPAHKVCGEFIAPSGCDILKKWDIHPIPIEQVDFIVGQKKYTYRFPKVAGSLSHLELDPRLAILAKIKGARILNNCRVETLSQDEIVLSDGTQIFPKNLILATGRMNQAKTFCYRGYKAHYEGLDVKHLEMHIWKDGYMGISQIEKDKFNVAALVKKDFLGHPALVQGKCLFKEWMSVKVPPFGLKKMPKWDHSYFIGDAAGTIPPLTGNGLSLAIHSGCLAAEYAIKNDVEGYRNAYRQRFSKAIKIGQWLQPLMFKPFFAKKFFFMTPLIYPRLQV